MITSVKMNGFKGNNITQELTGFDLFTGSNGKGKSSRLQAVSLSMMGYIPQYGKNLAEIYKLASDKEINVGLGVDNFQFDRSILRKETTKRKTGDKEINYTENITVSPSLGEKKIADKEARIKAELGNFPMMVDFQNFLDMSDTEKRKFIYSLTGANSTAWNKSSIQKYLESQLLTLELQVKKPEHYEGMKSLIIEIMKDYVDGIDVQISIENLIDRAKEKLSYYKEEAKKSEGTVQKLAELKNSTNIEGNLTETTNELEKLQNKLIEVEKLISTSIERKKILDNKFNKIQDLEVEVNYLKSFKSSVDVNVLAQKIKELKTQIKEVNYDNQLKEVIDEIQKLQLQVQQKQKEIQEVIKEGTEKKTIIETYQKSIEDISAHAGKCLIDDRIKCDKDFSRFEEYAKGLIANANKEKTELLEKYHTIANEAKAMQKTISALESSKQKLVMDERTINSKNTLINQEIIQITNQINTANNQIELNSGKLKLREEELTNLRNEMATTKAAAPVDALQKQSVALRENIQKLKDQSKVQEKTKNDYENLKKVMLQNKTAELNEILLNQLIDALGPKGLQGEIMKQGLEPLKSLVQENLSVLGIKNEFSFVCESEKGKEVFQFGWINGNKQFVDFNALSTGQQMMLLIAFLVAVIEKKSPKLKVLMIDNLNDLDNNNLKNVLTGLKSLSPKLDNIIVAGIINQEVEIDGLKIWNLDEMQEIQNNVETKNQEEAI